MLYKLIRIIIDELKYLKMRGNNSEFVNETQSLIEALEKYLRFL